MRILVLGSGAREDALAWRLAQSPSCDAIFASPGNAGTASVGDNWDIPATYGLRVAQHAVHEKIDLVVIGPDAAVAAGMGDKLREAGLRVFGPSRTAGRLESSKVFAKKFMERHGIPTAKFQVVHSLDGARKALRDWEGGVVIKADGLAAGKGVVVCDTAEHGLDVLINWYDNTIPGGGSDVLLEAKLEGPEVSLFALADGRAMVPVAAACDYKRAGDGDTGPNTGGMGAYSPPVGFPADMFDQVREKILAPVLRGLLAEGEIYIGVLYCGLMWTANGPYVIEFNARWGDPETQVLMPRVTGDFAALLASCADGAMDLSLASFSEKSCVGVVLATTDYPRSAKPLENLNPDVNLGEGCHVFWGGSKLVSGENGERTVSSGGGRVLTVTAVGDTLPQARTNAYDAVRRLALKLGTTELTYRTDIANVHITC